MGLIGAVSPVFDFLRDFWSLLPVAIRLVITTAFSSVVFIAVLRGIRS